MAQGEVEQRLAALESEGRLAEAAALAESCGMAARASGLYERACDFRKAAELALRCGDAQRAVVLSIWTGDESLMGRAAELAASGDPDRGRAAAATARTRGHGRMAGMILERLGDLRESADAYAEAGAAPEAAALYARVGDARAAARVLEAALRADPSDDRVAVRLGELLVQHRKYDAAMRVLQRVGEGSARRKEALPLLIVCAESLGLSDPARDLREQASRLGVVVEASPPAAPVANEPTVVYGRYELRRMVASTPAAQVFEARDRLTGSTVAVKQLITASIRGGGRDAFERLVREARVLEKLRHPNVVPLVELIADSGAIVTPWMAGGSLADLLSRGPVVPARAVEITCAVLLALGEAHALGILHRDVKPSNILFDDMGVPRLADFGAAHIADSSATATAGVIGTLAYMSPEQRLGLPATAASDIYSVGATLYEMIVGTPPLHGQTLAKPSDANPDLNTHHDSVVMSLVAQAPESRPAGALAARAALMSLAWPAAPQKTRTTRPEAAHPSPPQGARLVERVPGVFEDTWLGRDVLPVPLTPPMLAVARVAASVVSDGLPGVLRVDGAGGQIWWEVPRGTTLRQAARPLSPTERAMIGEAVEALHAHGLAHGAVDPDHVVLRHGGASLLWCPDRIGAANPADDLEGLARLP